MFNFLDYKANPDFTATYIGQYKSVGPFKKNVFCFRGTDGKVFHLWACVQLFNQLYGVPFQTKVHITYKGMAKMPDSERLSHTFEVEILDAVVKNNFEDEEEKVAKKK
jgi:hypothetical protein